MRVLLVVGMAMLGSMGAARADFLFGPNLVANGNAEAGPSNSTGGPVTSIPSWTSTLGTMTVVPYDAGGGFPATSDPGPADRGANFFAGGSSAFSSITQAVSVADGASLIDAGSVTFSLSAFLGGYVGQDDYSIFSVTFEDAANAALGSTTLTGPNDTSRAGQTGLLALSSVGTLPVGTRTLLFELDAMRVSGSYNDGYADDLSFVASGPSTLPTSVPEPASLALLGMGVAGIVAARRRRAA